METIAFYSYKGGVGRTLLVANAAQFLAMSGRRVVALDLDLEAPSLHQKLGTPEVVKRSNAGTLRGAVDELLASLRGSADSQTTDLREVAIGVDLPLGTRGSLSILPAGSAPSHAYWAALEQLGECLRKEPHEGGLLEAVLELQLRIQQAFDPDVLLVDSRTGITELGGLATSILADRVVCMTTTAPDSLDGTRVVAEALRAAPRLSSQKPLQLDFLVTRVPEKMLYSDSLKQLRKELGDRVGVIPHDSGISADEQLLARGRPTTPGSHGREHWQDTGRRYFSATLDWIAASFPGYKEDAESAKHRMEAVHTAWEWLTRSWERIRGGTGSRDAWPVEQLRERVRFEKGEHSRQADIVVYTEARKGSPADPLMIIEYVDKEDRDAVADWWLSNTEARVVAILTLQDRRLYSEKRRWDRQKPHSERWDLPLPHDFEALPDPTDVSVDAMLDAVRRGHTEYLDRLVTEWVRSSASGLHGGAPWKPDVARRIVDGLANVEDVELAKRILWATALGRGHRRGMWLGDGDEYLDQQVIAELFTPLLWRLPAEASMELMRDRGRTFGPPAGKSALAILARELLALDYDPDASFRREGQAILERSSPASADLDSGLYALSPAFRCTEITFKLSSDRPPLAATRVDDGENDAGGRRTRQKFSDLKSLVEERISSRNLVTTGLLGNYDAEIGRVTLYAEAIDECATKLALRSRHVGSVTLIHETVHALMHLGRDLDKRMWPEFNLPRADNPLFEPSAFHEALAQYFTYTHILRLRDPALQNAFEAMADRQHCAYRAWRQLHRLPLEDVRSWFLSIRRGTGSASFIGLYLKTILAEV